MNLNVHCIIFIIDIYFIMYTMHVYFILMLYYKMEWAQINTILQYVSCITFRSSRIYVHRYLQSSLELHNAELLLKFTPGDNRVGFDDFIMLKILIFFLLQKIKKQKFINMANDFWMFFFVASRISKYVSDFSKLSVYHFKLRFSN